jgi:transposase
MAKPIIDDQLWQWIEPLLPPPKPRPTRFPGRKRLDDRKALTGILFVLKTGIAWQALPHELGCGSGMSCWRRLREWQQAGVWHDLQRALALKLPDGWKIEWGRVEPKRCQGRPRAKRKPHAPAPRAGRPTAPAEAAPPTAPQHPASLLTALPTGAGSLC